MELRLFLTWLVSGGGAALIAYSLIVDVAFLWALRPKQKRLAAFGISGVIAMIGSRLLMLGGYAPTPETAWGWFESLFAVGTTAFGLATLIHTTKLPEA